MFFDQARLRSRVRGLKRAMLAEPKRKQILHEIEREAQRSRAQRSARAASLPDPSFDPNLPITARLDEIGRAMDQHQVVVVSGETGSGKSTQLPKLCLRMKRGVGGLIAHTQPRRVAARSVAARVAQELNVSLGDLVGYKIRFSERASDRTLVKVMTDGMLLAETQGDRQLLHYDTIIIDEAHERSLNIDFLLGYIKRLLPKRPELKVIITSATIDTERFSQHFASRDSLNGAPIIEVSGRGYPVEMRYTPLTTEKDIEDVDMLAGIVGACFEVASLDRHGDAGDTLIFVSGEREIREAAKALREEFLPHHPTTEVLPLYSRLSAKEQDRVFAPHRGRRIVIATNVAETSLTVPGIRYVVDTGLARISRYSPRSRVQRLPIEAISRASADQRAGRCGRTGPGVCVRLYSEQDYRSRSDFTPPEVLRTNLASVILQMKLLHLGEPASFPFVEPPDGRLIRDGYETLRELQAIDDHDQLTDLGQRLARLPVDPRLGRIVLAGHEHHCAREAMIISAGISVQDPRERPIDRAQDADAARERFRDELSDFMSLLNLWRFFHEQSEKLSRSKLRAMCRTNFISHSRMREWIDVHRQLRESAIEFGVRLNTQPAEYEAIHKAVLAGLITNVAKLGERREYTGCNGAGLAIHPGSGIFSKTPKWIVAAELVRTTKLYARTNAKVQPRWIEEVGAHLLHRSYSEPFWDADSGRVVAHEKVSLSGLTIIPKRQVHYGPIDPETARRVFIHHILVEGEYSGNAAFHGHNNSVIADVRAMEHKLRCADLLAENSARFGFFDVRIPADIYSLSAFERWRKIAEREDPRLLFLSREDVLEQAPPEDIAGRFPDRIEARGVHLPLSYLFEPGADHDGVTLSVPLEQLNLVDPQQGDWLTPGALEERIEALIRTLPKQMRRSLVPAKEFARKCAQRINFGDGFFLERVAHELSRMTGATIPGNSWRLEALPEHLRMTYRVMDSQEREISAGKSLPELKSQLAGRLDTALAQIDDERFNREGLRVWDFDELPERVEIETPTGAVIAFPTLVDHGDSVAIALRATLDEANRELRQGLRRLFAIHLRKEMKHRPEDDPAYRAIATHLATMSCAHKPQHLLTDFLADRIFALDEEPFIRSCSSFESRLDEGWNRIGAVTREAFALLTSILDGRHIVVLSLDELRADSAADSRRDIELQLAGLFSDRFPTDIPALWLARFPVYLRAMALRLEKLLNGGVERDFERMNEVLPYWSVLRQLEARDRAVVHHQHLELARWMVEELRVSVFAQQLGTAMPISPRRVEEQLRRV